MEPGFLSEPIKTIGNQRRQSMKVLIIQEPDGLLSVVTDGPAEVICVSEWTPNDRLYRMTAAHEVSAERVAAILRDDPIGSADDERHAAVANRILSGQDGKPYLRPVE
jgi:hypothetical protein